MAVKKKTEAPAKYIAFRWDDSSCQRVRHWDQNCAGDQFDICSLEEFSSLRLAADKLKVPVYFLGLSDDYIEEGTLLSFDDEIPLC